MYEKHQEYFAYCFSFVILRACRDSDSYVHTTTNGNTNAVANSNSNAKPNTDHNANSYTCWRRVREVYL
jgi:hypothetical protein